MPAPTKAALEAWIQARGTEEGPLFVNFDRAGKGGRLTGSAVHFIVRGLGTKAALTGKMPKPVRTEDRLPWNPGQAARKSVVIGSITRRIRAASPGGTMQGPAVTHLSIRVPWHDNRWDGRVCSNPADNQSCIVLRAIAENRDDAAERQVRNEWITDLEEEKKPPCLKERGTFLSERPVDLRVRLDYSHWSQAHKHMLETIVRVPAWGASLVPFRWMLRETAYEIAKELNLDISQEREPTDPPFLQRTDWIQDHENQRALLDGFAQRCVPNQSLTFFYAKRTPLADDDRRVSLRSVCWRTKPASRSTTTINRLPKIICAR